MEADRRRAVIWLVVVALLGGGGWLALHLMKGALGDACRRDRDCRSSQCLMTAAGTGGRCTIDCPAGADCPSGFECIEVVASSYGLYRHSEHKCARP